MVKKFTQVHLNIFINFLKNKIIMKKIILFIFTILIIFSGCSLINSKRLYFKYIKTANIEIEWFYYSYLTSYSPNYIIATCENKIDTICISNNIIDVNINLRDSLVQITFNGSPCLNGEKIKLFVIHLPLLTYSI